MARTTAKHRAIEHLAAGRVVVTFVNPARVESTVRGDGVIWHQQYRNGAWSCECPSGQTRRPACSHLLAVRAVVAVSPEGDR